MNTPLELSNRFREVTLNGTWIANTNYKKALSDIDWEIANTKIHSLNTIAVLVQHIHYYIKGVKNVFEGGSLDIRDKYSFDFPPVGSKQEWDDVLNIFWQNAEAFAALIEQTPPEKLNKVFVDKKYGTYQRNIDGIIEHCYYHLGQIVLIKKMVIMKP